MARKRNDTTKARLAREENQGTSISECRHVPYHQNAAYLRRRVGSVTDAALWWSGPEWLLLQCVAAKLCD